MPTQEWATIIRSPHGNLTAKSPDDLNDADFFSLLLIIVEPLAFHEIDASESGGGFNTLGFPFTLMNQSVNFSLP